MLKKGLKMKLIISFFESIRDFLHGSAFTLYLCLNPRLRSLMYLEIDHPVGAESGTWLGYDNWPISWKRRLKQFYLDFLFDRPLAKENPLPLSNRQIDQYILYRNVELARDTYFAQVAHSLFLERRHKVPWRFADWSNNELRLLLSSQVCFKALRSVPEEELYYGVRWSSRILATENILDDPRTAFQFMQQEPEDRRRLLSGDPSETARRLSGWFHDYLWHHPGSANGFDPQGFHRSHPLLMDRLTRYYIESYEDSVYVTPGGCGSASSLFMDLMRAVNIPIRKVNSDFEEPDGRITRHSGVIFDWQGGSGNGRYLLHTDDLYFNPSFHDTAPNPPSANRGITLWDHVWLNPTEFGKHFDYDSRPQILATASLAQRERYRYLRQRLSCSHGGVSSSRYSNVERWITFLQEKGCTQEEAINAWETVITTVTAYGDGDLELGYQRLLDGPDSRHALWCDRTGKC